MSETRVVLGVRHHYDRRSLLIQLGEQLHNLGTILGIQVTRWLIGQDHLRVGDYRLFILDTMYRILVRRMPVLEGDSQYRDDRDKSEGYQINPPIHRGLISEIL